ncbi:MAG: hypothetical protein V7L00_33300 [Nostoc sp.]|uniref:hypothetical protein n=1 Tax=Nostoc sp. TaxID=1180 RepID=UPI002FF84060
MKRFTLATLAVLISASSILALSPNANAESREQYCRDHRCDGYNRDHNYNRDSERNYNRDRGSYQRSHDQNHRQRYRYYDRSAHQWRYGYR